MSKTDVQRQTAVIGTPILVIGIDISNQDCCNRTVSETTELGWERRSLVLHENQNWAFKDFPDVGEATWGGLKREERENRSDLGECIACLGTKNGGWGPGLVGIHVAVMERGTKGKAKGCVDKI